MKKLVSLILVLTGMVSTASAWNYLRGSFSSWANDSPEYCTDNGPVAKYLAAGSYTFKIYSEGDPAKWWGNGGTITDNITLSNLTDNGGNITLTVSNPGYYVFKVTWNNNVPTLEVKYPDTMVYFYNNLGWENVYLHDGWWRDNNGASNVNTLRGVAMTAGANNVYSAYIPRSCFYRITFTSDRQVNVGDGEHGAGYNNFHSTNVVWNENEFNANTPIYVPTTTSSEKNNSNYYYGGQWLAYPTYTRNVTSGNFGTICLPFNATVEGAKVYKIVSKVGSGAGMTGINLETVDELKAGKAYIYKATASTLTATYSGSYAEATEANGMLGNLSSGSITAPKGSFVVYDNQIHEVDGDGVNVGQYKAYITLTGISEAGDGARADLFLGFDDETTGIETVKEGTVDNAVFNLQGQRVMNAQKGLYIVNGKKMLMK